MHLHTRNINTAFRELVQFFKDGRDGKSETFFRGKNPVVRKPSRVGDVLMIEEPVTITYSHPRERVLFNAARDANPFFHLYESLWMLAGRRDIAPLAYYSSGYARQVQDGDCPDANGAYGHRWRHAYGGDDQQVPGDACPLVVDQLQLLITHLKADPNSRRAVLQMWNVEDDLLKVGSSRDVCCNTAVYFSLRMRDCVTTQGWRKEGYNREAWGYAPNNWSLDMTVTNRSNDLIWGTLGSDYVNLGFLQEYMAAHLGVEVGVYNQFSNNLHVYTERFKPEEWLKWCEDFCHDEYSTNGPQESKAVFSLVKDPATFDRELPTFVEVHSNGDAAGKEPEAGWKEPFLKKVASPMLRAFHAYKKRGATKMSWTMRIAADDWRIAATQWLERRINREK